MSKKRSYGSEHLKFLLAAIVFMVVLDRFVLDGTRPYVEEARQNATQTVAIVEAVQEVEPAAQEPEEAKPLEIAKLEPEIKIPERDYSESYGPPDLPQWRKNAVAAHFAPGQPKVIIVIDDLGVSRALSKEALELPGPLTLAFLPYAEGLAPLVKHGREAGHEVIVHMPMEPVDQALDMGGIFLDLEQPPEEFDAMLQKGLDAFEGYVGVNNHMGSRLTQDRASMQKVMAELQKRGLLFLDSRTIGSSIAAETAAEFNVPYAIRDVFLDHDESLEGVRARLLETEQTALRTGQAIAIGHPKRNTIDALKEWLPTLAEKGIVLVPVSAAVVTTPSGASAAHFEQPAQPHQ